MPPAIIRYPGSKAKLVPQIVATLPDAFHAGRSPLFPGEPDVEYREPFFGSGAMGLEVIASMRRNARVWINDIDHGMFAVWTAVVHHRQKLEELVGGFEPSVKGFYELKSSDGNTTGDIAQDALNKIALHRMSVSGFGAKAGGPIGGRSQLSGYTVGCRWSPASIIEAIRRAYSILKPFGERLRITNLHFREMLTDADENCLVYLDPPYYVKGGQLYSHNMSHLEHVELASLLRETKADWRLSYDDCEEIRGLYSWARSKELEVRYTNAVTGKQRPKNKELLLFPDESSSTEREKVRTFCNTEGE